MLKLSTKGRYATRILVYLATLPTGARAPKQEIADAEEMSADYVEQIMVRLRAAGLVNSQRGVNGGFTLARPAERITALEVVEATEGPLSLVPDCRAGCEREGLCVTGRLWHAASEALRRSLEAVTVAELARQARALREARAPTFHI